MYIKLFLLCAGFICSNALPVSSSIEGAKLLDQFDSYVNTTCPAFRDNVLVNRTTKYLLNCKDVALQNPPENTALINCMAIIASNIQLCKVIGNRQDTSTPNTVDDLYKMVDELKANKPADICEQFKRFDLFKESANITYIDNWTKILLNIFTSKKCLVACTEMVGDDSNEQCSLLLLINEKVQNDPQQNPKIIVTEPLNIATQNHFKDTAATSKTTDKKSNAVKPADAKPATVGKLETAQKAANIPVRTESNPPVQVTSVQSSPKEVQPLSKVISPPKLSIDPPLPSNTQGKGDSTNTAANNNGNSANVIPKQETTIPEEPTTHPTIPVPVNPKPAGDKPPSVPQIEVSQSAQNDIEIDFTNDPSRMGGDNQEDEYPNEDADDEAIPHESKYTFAKYFRQQTFF